MPVTLVKRTVTSNQKTDIVWQAYEEAWATFAVVADPMAPDEKDIKESPEAKKDVAGYLPSLIRRLGISHEQYYELPQLTANLDPMADIYYKSLNFALLKILASCVYDNHTNAGSSRATELITNATIDNHYMLIYEFILRITLIALDEDSIKKRKQMQLEDDDSVVTVLKQFCKKLKLNSDIIGTLFSFRQDGRDKVTVMVPFLNQLVDKKATEMNSLIFNTQDSEAPKKNFKLIKEALDLVQIKLRGYLLVYLDLMWRKLFPKEPRLVYKNDNLAIGVVLSYYDSVMETILKTDTTIGEQDETYKTINKMLFVPQNIKIIAKLSKKADELKDEKKKKDTNHSINVELIKLFSLDEKLTAIKDAVAQFTAFATRGGWIPILLRVIRPEVLTGVINRFQKSCEDTTGVCFDYLNENSEFSVGLAALPAFEWAKINTINLAIKKLTSPEMLARVYELFNSNILGLISVEEALNKHGLLMGNQHLIATNLTPQQQLRRVGSSKPSAPPLLPEAGPLKHSISSSGTSDYVTNRAAPAALTFSAAPPDPLEHKFNSRIFETPTPRLQSNPPPRTSPHQPSLSSAHGQVFTDLHLPPSHTLYGEGRVESGHLHEQIQLAPQSSFSESSQLRRAAIGRDGSNSGSGGAPRHSTVFDERLANSSSNLNTRSASRLGVAPTLFTPPPFNPDHLQFQQYQSQDHYPPVHVNKEDESPGSTPLPSPRSKCCIIT